MNRPSFVVRDQQGAAGKVFLIIFAIIALFAVVGFALWQPVIRPIIEDSIPARYSEEIQLLVPEDSPEISITVPVDWVSQRGLLDGQTALITSPDLQLEIEIVTWAGGSAPSFAAAVNEATDGKSIIEEPKSEAISESALLHYAIISDGNGQKLLAAIGPNTSESTSNKASAILSVTSKSGEVEKYLPTLASFLKGIEVFQ